MSGDNYKPRIAFDITEEQQQRANKYLAIYGVRRAVLSVILDDLLDLIENYGQAAVGLILDHSAKPREILPSMQKAEQRCKNG
jgi:hypothetical protein